MRRLRSMTLDDRIDASYERKLRGLRISHGQRAFLRWFGAYRRRSPWVWSRVRYTREEAIAQWGEPEANDDGPYFSNTMNGMGVTASMQ